MNPEDGIEQMDLEDIRAKVLDGANGQPDKRKVSDNAVLGLIAEVAWHRAALAAAQADVLALLGDLGEYGEHDRSCVRATYCAGRPTESGGYEQQFGKVWYESRPVDRTPPCDCGLAAALSRPTSQDALRAIVTETCAQAFMAGMKSQQYVSGGYGVTEDDLPSESAIVSRILGEDRT